MNTTASSWIRAAKILMLVLVPVSAWWLSWRHYADVKTAEANAAAGANAQRWLDLVRLEIEDSNQEVNKAVRKLAELDSTMPGAKRPQTDMERNRAIILQELKEKKRSLEFGTPYPQRRTSWNGQTDPDSVWHGQRQKANQTLIQHGLPTLEGKGAFPDSVAPRRMMPGQK